MKYEIGIALIIIGLAWVIGVRVRRPPTPPLLVQEVLTSRPPYVSITAQTAPTLQSPNDVFYSDSTALPATPSVGTRWVRVDRVATIAGIDAPVERR